MSSDLGLSEQQRLAVTAAITILSVCVILAAGGAVLFLVGLFFRTFSGVFLPLIVAAFLALVVKPYYEWYARRMPPILAVALVFLSFLLPVVAFFWFFGAIIAAQLSDLFDMLPTWWEETQVWMKEHTPKALAFWERYAVGDRLRDAIEGSSEDFAAGLQSFGKGLLSAGAGVIRGVTALLGWVVLPVYFAFFLIGTPSARSAGEHLPFLKEGTREDVVFLLEQFVEIMVAFFRGQLIVAMLQGVLFAVGFSVVGLKYGLVLGILLGFLNIVPYLGSIVGLAVCLPLAFFQAGGGLSLVVGVLVVFTVVQIVEGYLLTPKIMGDRTGLHPLAIIVAVFFWGTALGGISGMILAIPLTAFGVVLWRLAREKYIGELV